MTRPANEERRAEAFLVHEALVEPAMIAEEEALIGVVDDDGVVGDFVFVEVIEDAADVVIDGLNAAEIILDVDLIGPFAQGVAFQAGRGIHLEIRFGAVLADAHAGALGGAGAAFVLVVEVIGLGDFDVFEEVLVLGGGRPFAVGRLVVAHQEKGLVAVALLQPVEGEVTDKVGAVAGVFLAGAVHFDEDGIVVETLAGEDFPVVEAGRVGDEVPLADDGGLVAGGLEVFGDVWGGGVNLIVEGFDAGEVGVEAGEDDAAARGADGIGDEAVGEAGAALGDAVDVRGLVDLAAVGADGVGSVIVGHDEDDVGALLRGLGGEGGASEEGEQFTAREHRG